jgi:DNA-binding winged helix-turn-helix (wHTH) protein
MATETELGFGPFRLDVANEQLWQGEQALALTLKAFAVLRYLAERPGQLVTKDALFQAVWPETVVSDAALTVCIRELRQALGDNTKASQYIETVHRRGYRFIGPFSDLQGRTTAPPEMVHEQRADGGREVARKLVAILSADVQGYSRLMSADEVATVRTLTAYRAVLTTLIRRHRGGWSTRPGIICWPSLGVW